MAGLLVPDCRDRSLVHLRLDYRAQIRLGQVTTLHLGTEADDRSCDVFALDGSRYRVVGRGRISVLDGRQRRAERGDSDAVSGLKSRRQIATQDSTHASDGNQAEETGATDFSAFSEVNPVRASPAFDDRPSQMINAVPIADP